MKFTEFLDNVENTEQEGELLAQIGKMENELAQATQIPVVGKTIKALLAINEVGSITEFKETEHYAALEGWDCKIDFEKGAFSLYPGAAMRKKALKIVVIVLVGLFLFCRWRKKRKERYS